MRASERMRASQWEKDVKLSMEMWACVQRVWTRTPWGRRVCSWRLTLLRVAGLIFEADSFCTGSRFSSTVELVFQSPAQMSPPLRRLPSPEVKLITRPLRSCSPAQLLPNSLITSDADLRVYQSVLRQMGTSAGKAHWAFMSLGLGCFRAHCGCSDSHELECVCVSLSAHHGTNTQVRGSLLEVSSLLLLWGSWDSTTQAWWQEVPLPIEPSCQCHCKLLT